MRRRKPPGLLLLLMLSVDGVLLMAFFQVCGVIGGCDNSSLRNCVDQLKAYERQVADGIITYPDSELDELCRRYDDIAVCVRRATSSCPVDPSSHSASLKTKLWSGLDASFNFICKNGKRTYLQHVQCLSKHVVQSSLRLCNRTFHMDETILNERDSAQNNDKNQELCQITNKFVDCVYGAVRKHCGEEAATWQTTVIKKLRQPKMELFHGCTLGCSTVRHRLIGFLLTILLLIEMLT